MSVSEQTSGERDLADLRAEVAELRAMRAADRAELVALRAELETRPDALPRRSRPPMSRRRRATIPKEKSSDLMSRRRLFGLLGGAAALGTGLAVAGSTLTADPAGATSVTTGAADGDALQIGGANTNTAASSTPTALTGSMTGTDSLVSLTCTSGGLTVDVHNTGGGRAVRGESTNGSGVVGADLADGSGVIAGSVTGVSLLIDPPSESSGGVPLRFLPLPASAGPPTGTDYSLGSFWVDSAGAMWCCTVAGTVSTPGTWVNMSAPLVTLASPVRVYDSRVGFLPSTGPKTPLSTGTTVTLDVTNNSSGVPATASAVLGNITVTNSGNGFLTVYNAALSSAPPTSSINLVPGVTLANNFTSACNPGHNIKVTCGGPGPTDFIIDIFGYYP